MSSILEAKKLVKSFSDGEQRVEVLQGIVLNVAKGERIAILGRSGSGKSTLLHALAGLVDSDEGEVRINGESMTQASPNERAILRNRHIGFVYQFHHLLPEFSALENVLIPLLFQKIDVKTALASAHALLEKIGMLHRSHHMPHQLSGGERQRVAVSRALVTKPTVVFADEPTGNLDRENAEQVLRMIDELSRSTGTAFVVATHDETIAARMDRRIILEAGQLRLYDSSALK